jgi:hypothetical protein
MIKILFLRLSATPVSTSIGGVVTPANKQVQLQPMLGGGIPRIRENEGAA